MKAIADQRWAWLSAGVLCVLLAEGLLVPTVARASCGHYVVWGTNASELPPPTPRTGLHDEQRPLVPGLPCTGPGCSRHPPAPVTAPARLLPVVQDSWATIVHAAPNLLAARDSSILDAPSALPIRRATSIFHPPRQAAVPVDSVLELA